MDHLDDDVDHLDDKKCLQAVPGRTLGLGAAPGPVGGSEETLLEVHNHNIIIIIILTIIILVECNCPGAPSNGAIQTTCWRGSRPAW